MPEEIAQLRQRIQLLENLLFAVVKSDKYYFAKHLVLADGLIIKGSTGTGNKIGNGTTEKWSVYGVTPVVQAGAISSPSGGATVDSQARSAIDSIRTALTGFGITA